MVLDSEGLVSYLKNSKEDCFEWHITTKARKPKSIELGRIGMNTFSKS